MRVLNRSFYYLFFEYNWQSHGWTLIAHAARISLSQSIFSTFELDDIDQAQIKPPTRSLETLVTQKAVIRFSTCPVEYELLSY
jgi:hypothetical protein